MSKQNYFSQLPQADIDLIFNLCDSRPYHEVVAILARSRDDGGLEIKTSIAALCRFYTNYQKECADQAFLGQYGRALQVQREKNPQATLTGILALLECRLLAALKQGRAISDLTEEFRTLPRVHRAYLGEEKFTDRRQKFPNLHYIKYTRELAAGPDVDFCFAADEEDVSKNDLYEPRHKVSQETKDTWEEAENLEKLNYRKVTTEMLRIEKQHNNAVAREKERAAEVAAHPPTRTPEMSDEEWETEYSTWEASKTPVIPPFPAKQMSEVVFKYGRRNSLLWDAYPGLRPLIGLDDREAAA